MLSQLSHVRVLAPLGLFVLGFTSLAFGQAPEQVVQAKQEIPGTTGTWFGDSCAIEGDQAVVGSPRAAVAGANSGSAHVYRNNGGWAWLQDLIGSDTVAGDSFGQSVALFDDLLVVGSPSHAGTGTDQGAVYVFRWNGAAWNEEQKLAAFDAADGDLFGTSVAVADGVVAVGSPQDDDLGNQSGSVYVYRFNGGAWSLDQKVTASDGATGSHLGHSLCMRGTRFITGAVLDGGTGSAYVFEYNGTSWIEDDKLKANDGLTLGDQFGEAVGLDGDVAVVGAWLANQVDPDGGRAYVFRRKANAWRREDILTSVAAVNSGHFGISVAVENDTIVVGADNDGPGAVPGYAYVFQHDGGNWRLTQRLAPTGGKDFGSSVALSRDALIVGDRLQAKATFFDRERDAAVYRFLDTQLVAPAGSKLDFYSGSDAQGDTLVIGMSFSTEVYRRTGLDWAHEQDLVPVGPSKGFGSDPSVDADRIVVGAPVVSTSRGQAFVFRNTGTWTQEQVLIPSDGANYDAFGSTTAISGTWLAVGAALHDGLAFNAGAVYLFEFDGVQWQERQKLLASDGVTSDGLGGSLDMEGDVLVAGASGAEAAYVFRNNGGTWAEEQKLVPTGANYLTGRVVSLQGDLIAVGSGDTIALFRHVGGQWVEQPSLASPFTTEFQDIFIDGDLLVATADNPFTPWATAGIGFWNDGSQWLERWRILDDFDDGIIGEAVAIRGNDVFLGHALFEPDIALDVSPRPVQEGETLTLRLRDGQVGGVGLIGVFDVSGVPGFWIVASGVFDSDASLVRAAPVPAGLSGLEIGFLGIGRDRDGAISLGGPVTLEIQSPGVR